MDHIETAILNCYGIREAEQNMVFAARLVFLFLWLIDLEVVVCCHTTESQDQDCCHCTHIGFGRCCFLRINCSFLVYILIICLIQHNL